MENENRQGGYETGYGKPPRDTQFPKGQSGNPKGRPRGSKNLTTILAQALGEMVVIKENGLRKRATKADVIGKRLVNKAVDGDYRSLQLLIALWQKQPLINSESTPMTSDEFSKNTTLLGDAIDVLYKLGVPEVVNKVDAAKLRAATSKMGQNPDDSTPSITSIEAETNVKH